MFLMKTLGNRFILKLANRFYQIKALEVLSYMRISELFLPLYLFKKQRSYLSRKTNLKGFSSVRDSSYILRLNTILSK